MALSERWAIQAVFDATFEDIETNETLAIMNDLKECNLEAGQETVYSSGGASNVYINGFSHSKKMTGTASAATFNNKIIGANTGAEVVKGSTQIPVSNILTVSSNKVTLKATPVGTTGAEIKYCAVYNKDGSFGKKFTQDASASDGKFALNGKDLTFDGVDDGTEIYVSYECMTGADAQRIESNTKTFSKTVRVILDSLVQDACSGQDYATKIVIPKAKLNGSINYNVSAGGDPAVMDVSFEALANPCESKPVLWYQVNYDEDELL